MSGEAPTIREALAVYSIEAPETECVPPGYRQTEVGTIPENWEVRPLLSAVRLPVGQVDPRIEPYRSMVLVAPDHVESRTGRLLKKSTASDQGAISGKYVFAPGDIVYSKIRPYLQKAILADFHGVCSADMYPLAPAEDVSPEFMFAVLLGYRFSRFAENVSARSGIPKINREELAGYVVALPPLSEQRAIAAALSDVDALIAALDKLIAKKRAAKIAAMQQLLTGKRRLPGFSEEWQVKRLGDLGKTYGGITGKTKVDFGQGTARYIPFLNIMNNAVVDLNDLAPVAITESEDQNRAHKDDLFFNGSSETPEELGMCSVLLDSIENLYLNSFCFGFRLVSGAKVYAPYLAYLFRSGEGRKLLHSLAQGATRYNLSKTNFLKLELSLPKLQEQTAIATVLSDMDAEIEALEARLEKTRRVKQGIMQELLTGRTRLV